MFESPVRRIGVSGGTAPFFQLQLRQPTAGQSKDHFIGKDLAHAKDEVNFYEEARSLRLRDENALGGLLSFTMEYAGVFSAPELGGKSPDPKELLVLRNLRAGYSTLRMLDLKIGQKTAQAGWKKKSHFAAMRQGLVDSVTNSSHEGFRLEGFDGRPPALDSMDPLLDFGMAGTPDLAKKAQRLMFQRMSAAQVLQHFLDLHQAPADPEDEHLANSFSATEATELWLLEIASRLALLALACRRCPVPQKWIGSSIALCLEAGRLPSRRETAREVRAKAQVTIFDWGRSELNTLEKHEQLSKEERADRQDFWNSYIDGVDRLSWEAARAYQQRFGNSGEWDEVVLTVYDYDSATGNDFLGTVTIPLETTEEEETVELRTMRGGKVRHLLTRKVATVTYSVSWRDYPATSRLAGAWRVTIHRAAELPAQDGIVGSSDPFCEVVAQSSEGCFRFRQQTCVKVKTLEPEWKETFELPVARDGGVLASELAAVLPKLDSSRLERLLPAEDVHDAPHQLGDDASEAFSDWTSCLYEASNTSPPPERRPVSRRERRDCRCM